MANVFDGYQVTYLIQGGHDWDDEAFTMENALNAPQIGEGVVLHMGGNERAFRIVDVWTITPKHGGLEYGVYAFVEEVPFARTPLQTWGQNYYRD